MQTVVTSKYKLFGGLLLFVALNLVWSTITWKVVENLIEKLQINKYDWQLTDIYISSAVILFQLFLLIMMMKECRFIKVYKDKIVFINPFCPFLRKVRPFAYYDHKLLVREYSRGGYYEAVWLVKNNRLRDRISSFYYSNYGEIKKSIVIPNQRRLKINEFQQIAALFGMKIKG